jgi:SAM-dependent methyltransferase
MAATVSISERFMPSLFTDAQYRLLKRIAPGEPTHLSGEAYAGRSKLRVLLGERLFELCRGKDVLDFGCGAGGEAVELAGVASSVYGLDIVPRLLDEARRHAARSGVERSCTFSTELPAQKVDLIVSLDSFEHFDDPASVLRTMFDLLRPGGQVITSFGPTWYHPYGGHLFSVFPWAHLVFSEAALIRWRSDIRSDGATRFHEVEGGLNQMTIGRFERLVKSSPLVLESLETVPIRRLERLSNPATREFTTAIVRCVLSRPE